MPDDPSAIVIPFGKHRGATVAELLVKDPQYAEWLLGQRWLAERFAELHTAILSRGAGSDDTPEHNAIQARFLDPLFQTAFLFAASDPNDLHAAQFDDNPNYVEIKPTPPRWITNYVSAGPSPHPLSFAVQFEGNGIDVLLRWGFVHPNSLRSAHSIPIEIKPSLGDDYPAVMRQMQRLRATHLLIDKYAGSIPLHAVRSMFGANSQNLITLQEVEAEIPNARSIL